MLRGSELSFYLAGTTVARTRVISNSQSPVWNERFKIPLAHSAFEVEFYVKDNDVFNADLIDVATVSARRILSNETISEWLPILNSLGKPPKLDASLLLEMRFTKCKDNPIYRCGITTDPDHFGVRNSYFLVRKGGSVKEIQNQIIHGVSALAAFRSTLRMISALILHMSNRFLHFLI